MNFEINLFRFDKDSDYLPYYTKHFIKISEELNLLDILNKLNKESKFSYKNEENFDLVLNNIFVKANISIKDIVSDFGKYLKIEPISIKRAKKDLIINEDDFTKKLDILKAFISKSDKIKYLEFKSYYYASNTLKYYNNYIGDAIIVLGLNIIDKNPSFEKTFIEILKNQDFSINYHISLENRIYKYDDEIESKINTLIKKIDYKEKKIKIENINFIETKDDNEVIHDFKDFNISCYPSKIKNTYNSFLKKLKASFKNLDSLNYDIGRNIFKINPQLTFNIAKDILLDLIDNNVDLLIIDSIEFFYIFDYCQKDLEKLAQREINLPILHISELKLLSFGEFEKVKKTLKKHKVKPQII